MGRTSRASPAIGWRTFLKGTLALMLSASVDYTVWRPGEIMVRGRLSHTNLYETRDSAWPIVWSHASGVG